ncbi:hypothetical protein RND71_010957 [Anisodus tanguticus]|uniref:Uncharacterized protein n=1 Tax=Anisodus tanguticus TaxID=243964 RepID=A0AAE1VJL1_9SOLA|nr:hypothetical protein RND71_010957 [Anisodus tanguticus]
MITSSETIQNAFKAGIPKCTYSRSCIIVGDLPLTADAAPSADQYHQRTNLVSKDLQRPPLPPAAADDEEDQYARLVGKLIAKTYVVPNKVSTRRKLGSIDRLWVSNTQMEKDSRGPHKRKKRNEEEKDTSNNFANECVMGGKTRNRDMKRKCDVVDKPYFSSGRSDGRKPVKRREFGNRKQKGDKAPPQKRDNEGKFKRGFPAKGNIERPKRPANKGGNSDRGRGRGRGTSKGSRGPTKGRNKRPINPNDTTRQSIPFDPHMHSTPPLYFMPGSRVQPHFGQYVYPAPPPQVPPFTRHTFIPTPMFVAS